MREAFFAMVEPLVEQANPEDARNVILLDRSMFENSFFCDHRLERNKKLGTYERDARSSTFKSLPSIFESIT